MFKFRKYTHLKENAVPPTGAGQAGMDIMNQDDTIQRLTYHTDPRFNKLLGDHEFMKYVKDFKITQDEEEYLMMKKIANTHGVSQSEMDQLIKSF